MLVNICWALKRLENIDQRDFNIKARVNPIKNAILKLVFYESPELY